MNVSDIRTAYTETADAILEKHKKDVAALEQELNTILAANQKTEDSKKLSAVTSRLFRHRA